MKALDRRLKALESKLDHDDLTQLSDEELHARLIAIHEDLEGFGVLPTDWREAIERGDFKHVQSYLEANLAES